MSRTKHGFFGNAVAATLAVVALGVASVAQAATDLTVWHAYRGDEKAAFEKVVAQYNAKQQTVVVKTLAVPYDAYADKITASVPRGKGPDVFIFAQDRLGGWVEAGQTIEPIDFFLDPKVVAQLVPGMMEAMTYRDTVYGLPLNYKSIAMIYNTALVKTPPKTTGELVKLAKGLTNVPSGRFGLAYEYSNFFFHAALMNAFGGQVFAPGPKPVIDSPQNVAAGISPGRDRPAHPWTGPPRPCLIQRPRPTLRRGSTCSPSRAGRPATSTASTASSCRRRRCTRTTSTAWQYPPDAHDGVDRLALATQVRPGQARHAHGPVPELQGAQLAQRRLFEGPLRAVARRRAGPELPVPGPGTVLHAHRSDLQRDGAVATARSPAR